MRGGHRRTCREALDRAAMATRGPRLGRTTPREPARKAAGHGIKTRLFLQEEQVAAVFTLIDLYGMDRVQHLSTDMLEGRVEKVRGWLRGQVHCDRSPDFFPHIAVHETEAWILAEGSALARRLSDPGIHSDRDAESRDFQKPPHERINDLFLSRKHGDRYQKIRDGRPLFATMEFEPVYRSCH